MKKLAIVIPVWNNWQYTKKAIKDLEKLPDTVLIIVDNGSTDGTKNLVSSSNLIVIHNEDNWGFAKGCNRGYLEAKKIGSENVMFLNNDIKVDSDFETWTLPILDRVKDGVIVGPTVGWFDENLNFICEASKFPSKGFWYMSGWNITASIETWDKLILEGEAGPFSSEFGRAYFEDGDLSFRAQQIGIKSEIISVPVRHFGKATSRKMGLSDLYLNAKSIFLKKWK